jgi:glutathione peroxidase
MAALFVAMFTVVSVSRLNSGGAMPDTRASHGGDGALDLAAHASATAADQTADAAAQRRAAVPLPEESAESLKDRHSHAPQRVAAVASSQADGPAEPQGLFALTANDVRGKPVALSRFSLSGPRKNRAVLVVNTASACGYTKANFEGLVALKKKYGPFGLEVLSFPSNSFRNQEPLDGEELEKWARDTYGATFPIFEKLPVVGPKTQPVYRWIREQLGGGKGQEKITWNFWKVLVDGRTGRVVKAYDMPFRKAEIEHDVYALLTEGKLKDEGDGGGEEAEEKAAV